MKKKLVAMIAAGAMVASMVSAVAAYAEEVETPISNLWEGRNYSARRASTTATMRSITTTLRII